MSFHKVIMADLEEGGWWSEQLETELVKKLNYIGSWRPVTVLFNFWFCGSSQHFNLI